MYGELLRSLTLSQFFIVRLWLLLFFGIVAGCGYSNFGYGRLNV